MRAMLIRIVSVIVVMTLLAAVLACSAETEPQRKTLRVATTTSLYDTGLWDYLEILFEERYDVDMQITAKGTGMALELGQRGDVDVVTVHDPAQEAAFVAGGYASAANVSGDLVARVPWAYNYFIIVGPEADPAGIGGGNLPPEQALQTIQMRGAEDPQTVKFVSRGDNSGTHGKEKAIWASAGYDYAADIQGEGAAAGWYVEAGTGMGATLVVANEKIAYTLTDIGTFLAFKGDLDLVSLLDTGDILLNVYTVIICKNGVNPEMAQNLVDFLRAPEIQALVAGFGVPEYGGPLFHPYDAQICG